MNRSDYIIDFDVVNKLTTSVYDDPNDTSSPIQVGRFAFSVSRKLIKEYLDIFTSINSRSVLINDDKIDHVINTLEYNGIIIHKSTIRDGKINKLLEHER